MPGAPDIHVRGPGFYAALNEGPVDLQAQDAPRDLALGDTEADSVQQPPGSSAVVVLPSVATGANVFGVRRLYPIRPIHVPDLHADPNLLFAPTAEQRVARAARSVAEIIAPYPNITAWRWNHEFWANGDTRSITFRRHQQLLAQHADFVASDFASADFVAIEAKVVATKTNPWDNADDGWKQVPLTIGVPVHIPRTQAEVREARNREQRARRREDPDVACAPALSVEGQPFVVNGAWMRSLTGVIKQTWEKDPLARHFHTHGFEERGPHPTHNPSTNASPNAPPFSADQEERILREVYDSPAFLEAQAEAQAKLGSTTNLPIVIIMLMFWSDATHLAQFGTAKLWPIYLFFGNLSKYIRMRRSAKAAYHVAYLPAVSMDFTVLRSQTQTLCSFPMRCRTGFVLELRTARSQEVYLRTCLVNSSRQLGNIFLTTSLSTHTSTALHLTVSMGRRFSAYLGSSRTQPICLRSM
jgi:hypothetical protein